MDKDERLVVDANVEIVLENAEYLDKPQINRLRVRIAQEVKKVFTETTGFMEGWFKVHVDVEQKILNKEYCE